VSFVTGLRCRECGNEVRIGPTHVCEFCFGPLEVAYDYDALAGTVTRDRVEAGPASLWRYADLLPLPDPHAQRIDLGDGLTPLVPAPRLAEELGLGELYLKNDTVNPTFSFKDRVVTVALTVARTLGLETVACASTGNLANSVAAHAAQAGMDAYVFVPSDLEPAKIVASAVYAPTLVSVKGSYDDVNRLCAEVAGEHGWAFVNVNVRPYYAEGSKTIGFEACEQLGWEIPDHVVAPMASGSMISKIDKAFSELTKLGLAEEKPWRVSGAQPAGCAPIADAMTSGAEVIRPVKADTESKSLAIGNPADGLYALDAMRRTGGAAASATDQEMREGIRLLARTEGIFAETAGGVTVAALRKLAASGDVSGSERVVAVISGVGLKTVDALAGHVGPTMEIAPDLDELNERLGLA